MIISVSVLLNLLCFFFVCVCFIFFAFLVCKIKNWDYIGIILLRVFCFHAVCLGEGL